MVATQNQAFALEADPVGDLLDKAPKVGRRHAGVAALLVDLVAGRLDQHRFTDRPAPQQSRLDDHGMGGADRGDPDWGASPAIPRYIGDAANGHALCSRATTKASSSACVEAPSIGPCRSTALAPAAAA